MALRTSTTIKVRLCVAWIVLLVWHFTTLLFKAPPQEIATKEVLDSLNKNQFWYCVTDFGIWYVMALIISLLSIDRAFIYTAVIVQDIALFLIGIVWLKETFDWSMTTILGFFITLIVSIPLFWFNKKINKKLKAAIK